VMNASDKSTLYVTGELPLLTPGTITAGLSAVAVGLGKLTRNTDPPVSPEIVMANPTTLWPFALFALKTPLPASCAACPRLRPMPAP
jgi:hypothetical protein